MNFKSVAVRGGLILGVTYEIFMKEFLTIQKLSTRKHPVQELFGVND